jgi:hypothetical protein
MKIINQLKKYIPKSKLHMSSFGIKHILNSNYYNIKLPMNSGTFIENNFLIKIKEIFYNILIKKIFGKHINNNFFIKNYKTLCKIQNRLFNWELIVHSIVFSILKKYNLLNNNICCIGDGKANFVSGLLFLNDNQLIIYSVNLPQALIQDYKIIKKFDLVKDKFIKVVNYENDLNTKNIKIFLIPANNKKFLLKKNISLFVNMFSFQEMPYEEIEAYFKIIKSNKSYLYSLNSKIKEMYDGTFIKNKNYPWNLIYKKIFHKEAKFAMYYYNLRYPFIHKKKVKVINSLVKF